MRFSKALALLALILVMPGAVARAQSQMVPMAESKIPPPPSGLKQIWVLPFEQMSVPDRILAETVQGLANRGKARVWLRERSFYTIAENQLKHEGVTFRELTSPWDLLREFRPRVNGIVIYKLGTPSLDTATSLCGIMDGVAVDESQLAQAQAMGLKVLADARTMTDQQVFDTYGAKFTHGMVLEQHDPPDYMRDFAVKHRIFTFETIDPAFRATVLQKFGPQALVYGWGLDEYKWISAISEANSTGVGSNWGLDLSALELLPGAQAHPPVRSVPKAQPGMRYIAFVLTDGDNVPFLMNNFVDQSFYYGSPLRGTFPMTWEISDIPPVLAPRLLPYLYQTATPNDGFVIGAGAPGYTYVHFQPNSEAIAQQARPYIKGSGCRIVNVVNSNKGTMEESLPILNLPEVDGVLYKAYAPYWRENGRIIWSHGKPCISFKFGLWEKLMEPAALAQGIAAMPTSPLTDENSYALVTVHAWSFGTSGGPMEAIKKTLAMLPPNTKVVTADQIVEMLRQNFGKQHMQ